MEQTQISKYQQIKRMIARRQYQVAGYILGMGITITGICLNPNNSDNLEYALQTPAVQRVLELKKDLSKGMYSIDDFISNEKSYRAKKREYDSLSSTQEIRQAQIAGAKEIEKKKNISNGLYAGGLLLSLFSMWYLDPGKKPDKKQVVRFLKEMVTGKIDLTREEKEEKHV